MTLKVRVHSAFDLNFEFSRIFMLIRTGRLELIEDLKRILNLLRLIRFNLLILLF
jgi:hypothetical protein